MSSSALVDENGLDTVQVAHLRHWRNLSRQPVNDWSLMGGRAPGQDDFSSYRYQLAYMIYGAALVHRHRLPAAPGLFQPMIQSLMTKLLAPETWLFWKDTSRGGAIFNEHLSEGYVEQWDPVLRDNIMFSAYVQSGALLHDYLFGSDMYSQAGSLTFKFWTPLWGGSEKSFEYDRNSLNDHIYWQMVRNGYLGVACEPNCIFQICNQPAIFGFRLHDLITGGSRAAEVTQNYERAWAEFGRLDETGHYNMMIFEDSYEIVPNTGAWVDAWCGTLMNMWNREFVHANYTRQITDLVQPQDDGTLFVRPSPKTMMGKPVDLGVADHGWVAAWASEMGDANTRDGVLAYADAYLNPTYRDGGLYYPRNDTLYDDVGRYIEVDPMAGNVLFAYARLNVADGLWKLYNQPWNRERFSEPAITAVDDDIDISRAYVNDGVLTASLRSHASGVGQRRITVGRVLGRGNWRVAMDGVDVARIVDWTVTPLDRAGPALACAQDGEVALSCPGYEPHTFVLTPEV
ncbi:hypothetical protein ACQI5H_20235 [Mycobacterium heidelbergense]|uniref:linalool dehydratase/isomerase domain-containing protein n=1 Tax=Mycobacterium heidelbergense TaxID=53376 RepID=UPI003CE9F24D